MESNQMKDKNMAAIRAVVAELAYAILPDNYRGNIWLHKLLELQRKALIALSKPALSTSARNCDRFADAKTARQAWLDDAENWDEFGSPKLELHEWLFAPSEHKDSP